MTSTRIPLTRPLTRPPTRSLTRPGPGVSFETKTRHRTIGFAAAGVGTWQQTSVEAWAIGLEALRRIGVALYLFGITFGLGTIIHVLRFQSIRVRQVAARV